MPDTRMAMWVHGNAVTTPQLPAGLAQVDGDAWTDLFGKRVGWGTIFRGHDRSEVWFHFPIPTPVLVPTFSPAAGHYTQPYGQRFRLERIFVLHWAESVTDGSGQQLAKAWIKAVDVWDGGQTRYPVLRAPGGADPATAELGDDGMHATDIQDRVNSWLVLNPPDVSGSPPEIRIDVE